MRDGLGGFAQSVGVGVEEDDRALVPTVAVSAAVSRARAERCGDPAGYRDLACELYRAGHLLGGSVGLVADNEHGQPRRRGGCEQRGHGQRGHQFGDGESPDGCLPAPVHGAATPTGRAGGALPVSADRVDGWLDVHGTLGGRLLADSDWRDASMACVPGAG